MYTDIPGGTPITTLIVLTGQCGTSGSHEGICYSREHSLPNSWWGHYDDAGHPQYTDLHHLFPSDQYVNLHKSNYPLGQTSTPVYTSNNGSKVGPCTYSGFTGVVFEPINEYKGDFARAYFYMATRYKDSLGAWVKNFPSTESKYVIDTLTNNYKQWFINMLLAWHIADPVSTKEINRNNAIYYNTAQHNRNPFVDHPEYVQAIWGGTPVIKQEPGNHASDFQALGTPPLNTTINVTWTDATGGVLPDGYIIKASSVGFNQILNPVDGTPENVSTTLKIINQGIQTATFTGLNPGTTYYFKIFPYTNSDNNINYKTDGSIPRANAYTSKDDLAIVAYQFDDPDIFAFLLLKDIQENSMITFTDNAWDGGLSAFRTGEGTATWTAPSGGLSAGSMIKIQGTTVTGGGTVSSNSMSLSTSGDQIIAYQGSSSSPAFITALTTIPFISSGSPTTNNTYLPTGLSDKETAISFTTEVDNGYYSGPTSGTVNFLRAAINNPANWTTNNSIQTWPSPWTFLSSTSTVINQNTTVQNSTVASTETMTINSGKTLTVNGTLTIKSDASGTGSFIDYGSVSAGAVNVEKFIPKNTYGRTVAAPVDIAGTSIFAGSDGVKYYDPITTNWQNFTSGNMIPMKGYFTRFSSADATLSFNNGNLYTGTKSYTDLWRTGIASGSNHGWNFIGNPYPSAINWDYVVTLNGGSGSFVSLTKLNNSIYVSDGNGGYKTYINGVGTPDNLVRIIPPATAFWVQVNNAYINATAPIVGATLTFNNTVRVHQNSVSNKIGSAFKIIRLALNNNNFTDGLVVRFENEATTLFDPQFDAFKMMADNVSYPQIYSLSVNNDLLSINSIPDDFSEPVAVPIGFKDASNKPLTINASDFSDIDSDLKIYLEDKSEKKIIDLRNQQSYAFNATSGVNNARFVLHIGHLSPPNIFNSNVVYTFEDAVYVNTSESNSIISIYNMMGQQVYKSELGHAGFFKIDVNLRTGSYIINMTNSGSSINQKVFINNK